MMKPTVWRFVYLPLLAGVLAAAILAAIFFGLGKSEIVVLPKPRDMAEVYDLIVAGSDPEGIAAAVSGARNGLSVLLVDHRPVLGGLLTRGWLNSLDMNYGPDGEILNKGIFSEFYRDIEGDSFDVNSAVSALNRLAMAEKNLTVALDAQNIRPLTEEITPAPESGQGVIALRGVEFEWQGQTRRIYARSVIDATQDADLAALAGASFTLGQADIGRRDNYMAVTLVFKLDHVGLWQWLKIWRTLRRDDNPNTGANLRSAWGFSEITAQYQPQREQLLLRGLNLGRQKDGSVLVNALLIFGVDPLDADSRRAARDLANRELPAVTEFLREHVPGLEQAVLGGAAPELYVRESRHLVSEYRLTLDDVLENRDFPDRIAFGSYPVDMQPAGPGLPGIIIGVPQQYAVPFRCLVPQQVDGLLVVGRSAGFDTLAHGSARTIPVGMAAGQAAGAAAAQVLENDLTFRQLSQNPRQLEHLQQRLTAQGVDLTPFAAKNPLAGHWAYGGLIFVRGLGLVAGGYNNDYQLDEPMAEQRFINLLTQMVKQGLWPLETPPALYPEGNIFNLYDAAYMVALCQGHRLSKNDAYEYLRAQGLFAEPRDEWQLYADPAQPLTNGAAYLLLQAAARS